MSQSWPLSQDVYKSGVCSICLATQQLHLQDGTVHKHGRHDSPCPSSNKLPLRASQRSVSMSDSPLLADSSAPSTSKLNSSQLPSQSSQIWSWGDIAFIKHIPKSGRVAYGFIAAVDCVTPCFSDALDRIVQPGRHTTAAA